MKASNSSETLVNFYQTKRNYIPTTAFVIVSAVEKTKYPFGPCLLHLFIYYLQTSFNETLGNKFGN